MDLPLNAIEQYVTGDISQSSIPFKELNHHGISQRHHCRQENLILISVLREEERAWEQG